MSELKGQSTFEDFLPELAAEAPAEGYDAAGNLMNVGTGNREQGTGGAKEATAAAGTSSVSAKALPPSPEGKAFGAEERLNVIAAEVNAITNHARVVLASASIEIGKRLIEARNLAPEGRFTEWLDANVDFSHRQAQLLMKLAEEYGREGLPEAMKALTISQMTALLSAPEEAREALAERVTDEGLSVRKLRAEIEKLKAENADQQTRIEALAQGESFYREMKERLDVNINDVENERDEAERKLEETEEALKTARRAIADEHQSVEIARAKAEAAEATADALRKEKAAAEESARVEVQRAGDAIRRAEGLQAALDEARARVAELEGSPVEVVPEAVTREIEALKRELEAARAAAKPPEGPSASERFKWFYNNQVKPAFTGAAALLDEVAAEDAKTAGMFAGAVLNGCKQLVRKFGREE